MCCVQPQEHNQFCPGIQSGGSVTGVIEGVLAYMCLYIPVYIYIYAGELVLVPLFCLTKSQEQYH